MHEYIYRYICKIYLYKYKISICICRERDNGRQDIDEQRERGRERKFLSMSVCYFQALRKNNSKVNLKYYLIKL